MQNNVIDYLNGLKKCADKINRVLANNQGMDANDIATLAYIQGYLEAAKHYLANQVQAQEVKDV